MNIILCDDERNFAEALREEIKNFFDNKSMQVNITWYGSGEELLKAFEGEKSDVDLLFMDIDLGAYDGVSIVRGFREQGKSFPVIFLSAMEDRVLDGFEVKAFYFLYKKDYKNRLHEILEKYLNVIYMNKIYWVESEDRETVLHTETGEMHAAEPMHSFAKKLDKEIFAEVYHCIYVNVDYVCRVDADSLLLDNGVVIPVSRRKRKEVMTAVMKRLVTR